LELNGDAVSDHCERTGGLMLATAFRIAFAGLLAAGFAFAAQAGSGSDNEDGQRPPVAQDQPPAAREESQPEPAKKECLTDKSGFRNRDGQPEFFVELINACDKPLVCVVKAYVIGAEGGKAGSGTLQMAAWRACRAAASSPERPTRRGKSRVERSGQRFP
jgi:hypothetical protein